MLTAKFPWERLGGANSTQLFQFWNYLGLFWVQFWPFMGPLGGPFGPMLALSSPLQGGRCPRTRSGAELEGPWGGPLAQKGGPEAHLRQPFQVFSPRPLQTRGVGGGFGEKW